jgi:hypothetical protein
MLLFCIKDSKGLPVPPPPTACRSVDCVQAALTLLMLAKCLGRYRPRTRGLFPLRWQQGRWLTWVAAGGRGQGFWCARCQQRECLCTHACCVCKQRECIHQVHQARDMGKSKC